MSDCQFFNLRLTTIFYRYTKSRVFRDTICENYKCYLCSESQTLVHLFADCVCSKIFWTDFTSWWNCKNNTQIWLQQRDILCAFHPGEQSFLGINYCLLATRNYIYISAKNKDHFYNIMTFWSGGHYRGAVLVNGEWNHYDGLWKRNSRGKGLQQCRGKWLPPLSLRVHFGEDFALKPGLYPLICRE